MYFSGTLSVDPSQETTIDTIQPTKVFKKLLHFLTLGGSSEREEIETFTAISILQQFNMAFRSLGLNNIVRLAKDDLDFYLDTEGKTDDLKEALEKFELETDAFNSEYFKSLFLVVEHEDDNLKLLIEVRISRVHAVGEFPIQVKVNGLIKEFKSKPDENPEAIKTKLQNVFSDQNVYDQFIREKKTCFDAFMKNLELEIQKFIHSDKIINSTQANIIRPKEPVKDRSRISHSRDRDPVYHGYHGGDDFLFYAFFWSSMCHHNHIYCNNVHILDDHGHEVMSVGEVGFDAGENQTLNPEESFEVPSDADTTVSSGSEFDEDISNFDVDPSGMAVDADSVDSGGSWFDSFTGGDDGGGVDTSSCSSCGSSCGGGCGGGCGGD